jgi:eukaryotic-like serine/threonine-protein kinase
MFLIKPGEFEMGSPKGDNTALNDELPQHHVRITRPFYLAECEVTYRQFSTFVERTGFRTEAEAGPEGGHIYDTKVKDLIHGKEWNFRHPRTGVVPADDEPVVQVSWNDAQAFCKWLSEQEGRTYRLPTEAEWEYACRAGTTTRWCTGDDPNGLNGIAWTLLNANSRVHPVGHKAPNAWGLHDMHGNAWEWCQDWFGPYPAAPAIDPTGLVRGDKRALRGGSWDYGSVERTRSASRLPDPPGRAHFTHGFRVAADPPRGAP